MGHREFTEQLDAWLERLSEQPVGEGCEDAVEGYSELCAAAEAIIARPRHEPWEVVAIERFVRATEYHQSAVTALSQHALRGGGLLTSLEGSPDPHVRRQVALAAAAARGVGEPILRRLTIDANPGVRQQAFVGLVDADVPDRQELLAQMREDPEYHIRGLADTIERERESSKPDNS